MNVFPRTKSRTKPGRLVIVGSAAVRADLVQLVEITNSQQTAKEQVFYLRVALEDYTTAIYSSKYETREAAQAALQPLVKDVADAMPAPEPQPIIHIPLS